MVRGSSSRIGAHWIGDGATGRPPLYGTGLSPHLPKGSLNPGALQKLEQQSLALLQMVPALWHPGPVELSQPAATPARPETPTKRAATKMRRRRNLERLKYSICSPPSGAGRSQAATQPIVRQTRERPIHGWRQDPASFILCAASTP